MKTVILTTFYNNVQAHMLQDLLRNEGIESMLQGELSAQVIAGTLAGFFPARKAVMIRPIEALRAD